MGLCLKCQFRVSSFLTSLNVWKYFSQTIFCVDFLRQEKWIECNVSLIETRRKWFLETFDQSWQPHPTNPELSPFNSFWRLQYRQLNLGCCVKNTQLQFGIFVSEKRSAMHFPDPENLRSYLFWPNGSKDSDESNHNYSELRQRPRGS